MNYIEIENREKLLSILEENELISKYAFQDLDFSDLITKISNKEFEDCIFLGCTLPDTLLTKLVENCLVFPKIDVPFNPFRSSLYTKDTLLGEYELGKPDSYKQTLDKIVHDHYIAQGKEAKDIKESLSRKLHDHSITDALYDLLTDFEERKIVAVMGGHGLYRNDADYVAITRISKTLTEKGYLMISGGGPGAMEATHVGAWMAGRVDSELNEVLAILSEAPLYTDRLWLDKAFEALTQFPTTNYKSVGIPTWLYGHEPPTPFATAIAKLFANSIREEGLLALAKGGVIFAPGSAGTIQEIFQDATQNHYLSYDYASPMVFFNKNYWTFERPVYPLLSKMSAEGKYKNMILSIYDTAEEIITEIRNFTTT